MIKFCLSNVAVKMGYVVEGHRPVLVKRVVIGSKEVGGSSALYLSFKVFRDWSIINIWEENRIY